MSEFNLNTALSRAYVEYQSQQEYPRNKDLKYVHASSLVNNPCARKYVFEYFLQDMPFSFKKSAYTNSIFKTGSCLEQDRIKTWIDHPPVLPNGNKVLFLGNWKCDCAANGNEKGLVIKGVKSEFNDDFSLVCQKCGGVANNYDEYQFKVDRIGISGRPDLVMVTYDDVGTLHLYEIKTVMKSDFIKIKDKGAPKALSHIKQSCIYYYFFKDTLSKKSISFTDEQNKKIDITSISPIVTVVYIDKREEKASSVIQDHPDISFLNRDWMLGNPNYFYEYNVKSVKLDKEDLYLYNEVMDPWDVEYSSDRVAEDVRYLEPLDTGEYLFYPNKYMKFLANQGKFILSAKKEKKLPEKDESFLPCYGKRDKSKILKSNAEKYNCPYAERCQNDELQ